MESCTKLNGSKRKQNQVTDGAKDTKSRRVDVNSDTNDQSDGAALSLLNCLSSPKKFKRIIPVSPLLETTI